MLFTIIAVKWVLLSVALGLLVGPILGMNDPVERD